MDKTCQRIVPCIVCVYKTNFLSTNFIDREKIKGLIFNLSLFIIKYVFILYNYIEFPQITQKVFLSIEPEKP